MQCVHGCTADNPSKINAVMLYVTSTCDEQVVPFRYRSSNSSDIYRKNPYTFLQHLIAIAMQCIN